MSDRRHALDRLYLLLEELRERTGGPRLLSECDGRMDWPSHGLYFFFEPGEVREDGTTPRVVRVGTHALTATSKTTLWNRLSQHRGSVRSGGGNHRGSIFRLHVGTALIARGASSAFDTWGQRSSAPPEVREAERELEHQVSLRIGGMPLLWLAVPDREERAYLERSTIALLSNLGREPVDPASPTWLGHDADRSAVRESHLWNVNHVSEDWDARSLDRLAALVSLMA